MHVSLCPHMMTSSNGNIFRITGPLCREFTGHRWIHRWIPHTKGQWRGALMLSMICAWINSWVNNREAGDLRRHRSHYDVIVMHMFRVPSRYSRVLRINMLPACWSLITQRVSFTTIVIRVIGTKLVSVCGKYFQICVLICRLFFNHSNFTEVFFQGPY